jgi:hypothetical protein
VSGPDRPVPGNRDLPPVAIRIDVHFVDSVAECDGERAGTVHDRQDAVSDSCATRNGIDDEGFRIERCRLKDLTGNWRGVDEFSVGCHACASKQALVEDVKRVRRT